MNLLENYIEEVISVEPYVSDWTKLFPIRDFWKVVIIANCYGNKQESTHIWDTEQWNKIKSDGYYWA
jgi:hypothetical protein